MPVPKGYTLDLPPANPTPRLPAGYTLDASPTPAPKVQPIPTATLSAPPTLGSTIKNAVLHPLNTLDDLAQPVSRPVGASIPEMATADLKNVAAGAAGVVRHPIDAATGALASLGGLLTAPLESAQGKQNEYQQIYQQANENGPQFGATTLGQSLATAGIGKVLPKPLEVVGNKMQDAGAGVINKTVGSLQRDFKRGADPGRAYLDAGGGPALSMDSLATKGQALKGKVGNQIGSAITDATQSGKTIPTSQISAAVNPPIQNARAVISGPGGNGNLAPIDNFANSFKPALSQSSITPQDLFDMKKNVSANTSWSDPMQFGLKKVQQQTAGALGGVLSDNVPELQTLNPQYQGLTNFASRAASRAATGSSPLTSLYGKAATGAAGALLGSTHGPMGAVMGGVTGSLFDSVPVKSTLATGLYRGGRGAVAVGKGLKSLYGTP